MGSRFDGKTRAYGFLNPLEKISPRRIFPPCRMPIGVKHHKAKCHIKRVITSDAELAVRVVDIDTDLHDPVRGPYDPEVTVVVNDVDAAALEHIKGVVPDYQPEEGEEEDKEEEKKDWLLLSERASAEQIECATEALNRMSEEWL
jgi:hypothetical protein